MSQEDNREAIIKLDGETIDFLNQYKEELSVESESDVLMISLSILRWYMQEKDRLAVVTEEGETVRVKLNFAYE